MLTSSCGLRIHSLSLGSHAAASFGPDSLKPPDAPLQTVTGPGVLCARIDFLRLSARPGF